MPKIRYKDINFKPATLVRIKQAIEIVEDYARQGYDLTLRQLYYQFVSRSLIPNSQREYKNLGNIVNDARLAGLIDWNYITDRTRNLEQLSSWDKPSDIIDACAKQFRLDLWSTQDNRIEVWIEKDALTGVIEGICNELRVPYFSCRGYTSQSEMWAAGQRLIRHERNGQESLILHFGDHDPSGIDMSRDIQDRLELFTHGRVGFERIALNMDQVQQYSPPPNPAKATDARHEGYQRDFGDECWELDALEPSVIVALVRSNVLKYRDEEKWKEMSEKEQKHRDDLESVADSWDGCVEHAAGGCYTD